VRREFWLAFGLGYMELESQAQRTKGAHQSSGPPISTKSPITSATVRATSCEGYRGEEDITAKGIWVKACGRIDREERWIWATRRVIEAVDAVGMVVWY
jgi:hypothetical protein